MPAHMTREDEGMDQAMCTLTRRRKRFQSLSLMVHLRNHGDTNRILSVLSKIKFWSVLDLSRKEKQKKTQKNTSACILQQSLKRGKKKIWVAACSHAQQHFNTKAP